MMCIAAQSVKGAGRDGGVPLLRPSLLCSRLQGACSLAEVTALVEKYNLASSAQAATPGAKES
jgi:hypothetical protein